MIPKALIRKYRDLDLQLSVAREKRWKVEEKLMEAVHMERLAWKDLSAYLDAIMVMEEDNDE